VWASPSSFSRRVSALESITQKISPIAWQHINLHGRYEFLNQLNPVSVDAIIQELTKLPMHRKALVLSAFAACGDF